jgi:hypothetical protein
MAVSFSAILPGNSPALSTNQGCFPYLVDQDCTDLDRAAEHLGITTQSLEDLFGGLESGSKWNPGGRSDSVRFSSDGQPWKDTYRASSSAV